MYSIEVATGKTFVTQPYVNTTKIDLNMLFKKLIPGATYKFSVRNSNKAVDGKKSRFSEAVSYTMGMYTLRLSLL